MSELLSALDALSADDLDDLVAPELLDRSALLVRARNRIDAELARTVRRADCVQASEHDGKKSMGPWLRGHLRLSPGAAHQIVRNGRTLEQLPALAAACAEGVVTAEQVAVMAPVATPKNLAAAAAQGVDLAAVDAVLAETAATRQHVHLGRVVAHYLARLDPDGTEPDPTEQRSLSIARHADGSRTVRGELDAVGGEKFEAMLESFVQADRPAGDMRTRAQQLADALVQAADVALASGKLPTLRTVKPHVAVIVPLADLVDPSVGPGTARTGFGAEISAARARWPACDGNVSRIVMAPTERSSTTAGRSGWSRRACAEPSRPRTGTACSPAARPPATGATSTMSSCGSATTAPPASRTQPCSASATTPRSTTASASNANATGHGAPTVPTAPRS